jgi:branched-chain amino acid transport system permease protein
MSPDDAAMAEDRDLLVLDRFSKMQRAYLKTLVTDAIIEEHRRKPHGQHSEPLERILIYFRQAAAEKYALKKSAVTNTYRIVCLSGVRGVAPHYVDDTEYTNLQEAYHGIFLKRLQNMLGS